MKLYNLSWDFRRRIGSINDGWGSKLPNPDRDFAFCNYFQVPPTSTKSSFRLAILQLFLFFQLCPEYMEPCPKTHWAIASKRV